MEKDPHYRRKEDQESLLKDSNNVWCWIRSVLCWQGWPIHEEERNKEEIDVIICSHLYKGVLTVSVKSVQVGIKGLIMSIPINLTLPRTRLVSAAPLTLTTDTGMWEYRSYWASRLCWLLLTELIMTLPGFAVAFHALSGSEHPTAVHTGAVFHRNTVAKVILIPVVWAVAAAITSHTGFLETHLSLAQTRHFWSKLNEK